MILFRKVDVSIRRDLLDLGDIARQIDIHERGGEKLLFGMFLLDGEKVGEELEL